MTIRTATLALSLACTLISCSAALAQSGTPALMAPLAHPDPRLATIHAGMGRTQAPSQVAIAPDASTVAYTLRGREGATLHLISATAPDPAKEKIVAPNGATACSNSAPAWSPDSQWLAYTSSCTTAAESKDKPGQDQIFLWSRATGESKQLTHLSGIFQQVTFAPDGKSLAFLFVQDASRSAGALAAMKPWAGVIGEDGVEIQRVGTIELPSGKFSFATPANLHVP